jgi:prephenate dehydrogenase
VRIAVLGVGLIGGSVALAARRRLGAHVVGWDPDARAIRTAEDRGAIDAGIAEPSQAVGIDVWVVATPVATLEAQVRRALAAAGPGAVVTDVGSVKRALVEAIDDRSFIGGHPLAGAETAGVENAREDLFDGATWYLTPRPDAPGDKYERLHRFASALGAVPAAIGHDEHDRVMAAVSHLPHVLANVLVNQAHAAIGGEAMPATGGSFRDATRVAGANPPLWAQIYAENAEALGAQLDQVLAALVDVRGRLGDLEAWQRRAAEQRRALLEADAQGGPLAELRVVVPNRPGVVADIALTLGRAGINIADMSLAPASDNSVGTVALWVADGDADRARSLVAGQGLAFA